MLVVEREAGLLRSGVHRLIFGDGDACSGERVDYRQVPAVLVRKMAPQLTRGGGRRGWSSLHFWLPALEERRASIKRSWKVGRHSRWKSVGMEMKARHRTANARTPHETTREGTGTGTMYYRKA